jgi:hypothetical protein
VAEHAAFVTYVQGGSALACDPAHHLAQVVLREALAGPKAHVLGSRKQVVSTHTQHNAQGASLGCKQLRHASDQAAAGRCDACGHPCLAAAAHLVAGRELGKGLEARAEVARPELLQEALVL